MKAIVLIHGYSAESDDTTKRAMIDIYGDLPKLLRRRYGNANVVEIDLSRYITLEDGISVDDVSRALDRVLATEKYEHLRRRGFHAIVHSTGALVIRNWLRSFSPAPSPLQNLIYLAGANFGSGWAHIGKGQLAKWGRMVLEGKERGIRILDALELGSNWTLDLHLDFLEAGESLLADYGVYEHVIIGTQADAAWYEAPIRYAKEDGSDGVIRVAAGNVNFNHVRFVPTDEATALSWRAARGEHDRHELGSRPCRQWYRITRPSRPGVRGRPRVPFAIPYQCAHSGEKMGIVSGSEPRDQVLRLIDLGLRSTPRTWAGRVAAYEAETRSSYERALAELAPGMLQGLFHEPRAQYDGHAQVILRLRDQDGRPVNHYDVFFDSIAGRRGGATAMRGLIEHKHVNSVSRNIITFYLRTDAFDRGEGKWLPRVPALNGCYLEITATEPQTDDILYLPLRYEFSPRGLTDYLREHTTTVIDVQLLRVPSPNVYRMRKY